MEKFKKNVDVVLLIAGLATLRLFMSIPNFEPIGAMALFGGSVIASRRLSFMIPLLALLAGDLILAAWSQAYLDYLLRGEFLWVYGSFLAVVLIGRNLIGSERSALRIFRGALLSSVLFFLVTNFGTWASGTLYSTDLTGLAACYLAGLAFYKNEFFGSFFLNSVMSTLLFSFIAFGLYAVFSRSLSLRRQTIG
ncbi:MAG: hypothetical protein H6606_08370 [Flavobacteriales bacterium]|nr:hypothetical protein [Flavobacteriales bacterium]